MGWCFMTRSVEEWRGKTSDSAIPPRVHIRVFLAAGGKCAACKNDRKKAYESDHIIPLILGGEHRESNLQLLCVGCHQAKTKLDVKLKAKVARVQKRHIGIKKPSRFPGSRDSKFKKKIDGSVVLR